MTEIMTLLVSLVLQGHSCLSASALLLVVGRRFLRQRVLELRRASDLCLRLMRIVVEEIALCLVP